MSTARVFNFGAGPAVLPEPVLAEMQRDLMALPGVGMSVLEISHRSKAFEAILRTAESNIRTLAGVPDEYHVLFMQGGASQQFAMVPMNLLPKGGAADYVITGSWAKKAAAEAKRFGTVRVAASTEKDRFSRIPDRSEIDLSRDAAYLHVTSNNTISGTQWKMIPDGGDVPVVVDASSDIFSRPIDVGRLGLIYAGAQKNLGPAGVTIVILRPDLAERIAASEAGVPTLLQYRTYVSSGSLYNTPPVGAIYVVSLVTTWLLANGGLAEMARRNEEKAAALYTAIDATAFYRGTSDEGSRSLMNVTFRLPTEALDAQFVDEAATAGFVGLKGHRSVGGLRASIYNACPLQAVTALADFMKEFERTRG